ncbi:MAG: hypothetical protein HDT27_01735 [Subdoligranulum sp.]|nr:hypothetical protein [Subdoligranulum sp.]
MDVQQEDEADKFSLVNSDNALGSRGLSNMSMEQIRRDKKISRLLEAYVRAYEKKSVHSRFSRYLILIPCMVIVVGFAVVLGWMCVTMATATNGSNWEELAAFITACVSFLALIIGILHIITEYFFPKDGEKYITDIVKLVQENDLKNRLETARFQESHLSPPDDLTPRPDRGEELDDLSCFEGDAPPSGGRT